ncbi:MAG TPA: hypothetical protein VGK25_05745 [Ignavibacteria bacterium]|jgi:hypothetical protein
MKNIITALLVSTFVLFVGCGKKSTQDGTSQKEEKKEETKQEQTKKVNEDSLRQAEENANKEKMVKFALEDEKMINDEKGQWAIEAEASSTYASSKEKETPYSPWQATGKPNVENYTDDGRAWATQEADKGVEWIRLKFEKAVNAAEVRARQNIGPGAIIKVELIDTDGKSHSVWEGIDKTKYEPNMISWFIAKFDKTPYKTKEVKLTLATNTVPYWNEIDAVQLIGE